MMIENNASKKRPLIQWIAILVGIVLLIALAYHFIRQWELSKLPDGVERGDLAVRYANNRIVEYKGQKYAYNTALTNILLLGTDNKADKVALFGSRSGGQADFLLLLSLDYHNKTVSRIQIDRDSMTQLTVLGVLGNVTGTRMAQICLAHGFGDGAHESCRLTVQAVKNLLGDIDIDRYASFNLGSISILNDWLGGVEVQILDDFSQLDPTMIMGTTVKLSGNQAEYFVRSRMNVGRGSNAERMVRQRQYLAGASSILESRIKEDSNALDDLYDLFSDRLITNMSRGRLINETNRSFSYEMGDVLTLKGDYSMGSNGFLEFHTDQDALTQLVLQVFYLPV